MGRLSGTVVVSEHDRPLEGIDVYLTAVAGYGERLRTRYAVTGRSGRFAFAAVPAGEYQLSAAGTAHAASDVQVSVEEGGTAAVVLALTRNQPALSVAEGRRSFRTRQEALVTLRGYVDREGPRGRDRLRVELYRARLIDLLRAPGGGSALSSIETPYEPHGELPDVLLSAADRVPAAQLARPITEVDREGFFDQPVRFGALRPGVYLVRARYGAATAVSAIRVTDIGLVAKRDARALLAWVVDLATGSPRAGAHVTALRGARGAVAGATAADGTCRLALGATRVDGDQSPDLVYAALGPDEASAGGAYYGSERGGSYVVAAYTDRPIYRPGQRIHYKGIVRRAVAGSPRYDLPAGESVSVEVRSPSGERVARAAARCSAYGSFDGAFTLSPEAETGAYTLITTVAGQPHSQDITVASYRKPEFAVTVKPDRSMYLAGETVSMVVQGAYYFGAPLAGAAVRYDVYRSPDWSAEYPDDYGFEENEGPPPGDYGEIYGESVAEGSATLDGQGRAVIAFRATPAGGADVPQQQIYSANVRVTDPSGNDIWATGSVPVAAGAFRLSLSPAGYVAAPGQPLAVRVETRYHDGKPAAGVEVTLDASIQEWIHRQERQTAVGHQVARTGPDGRATTRWIVAKAGQLKLTASARDPAGRQIAARAYVWIASDAGGDYATHYPALALFTDKRHYGPGETARVLVNAGRGGLTALLTVEGDRIYEARVVRLTRHSTVVRVPVRAEYGPNVFLSAAVIDASRFSTSEAPLRVDVPARRLRVSLSPDRARAQPGEAVTYRVRVADESGKPAQAELSLGVVDESVYALREDDPSLLRDAFYPRRWNRVVTSYSFSADYLGSADKTEPSILARRRFLDTAYWAPSIITDPRGRATATVRLPDNVTTWRATAIAQTRATAFGRETARVIATKDLLLRVEVPRFLTVGDRSRVLALVHNNTGTPRQVFVRGVFAEMATREAATSRVTVPANGVGKVDWSVTAAGPGEAKLRVTAWTPREAGARQLTDGVELALPVRTLGRERFTSAAGEVHGAGSATEAVRIDPAAIAGETRLTLRVTPSVSASLANAAAYLAGYPYGCTEQTMSRFLPDLLVRRLQGAGVAVPVAFAPAEVDRMVRDGLARLYRLQHDDGAWGWWEHDGPDAWMTAYVLWGLAAAREQGYPVSDAARKRGLEAALRLAPGSAPADRAFLLYAVARAGDPAAARAAWGRVRSGAGADVPALAHAALLAAELGGRAAGLPWKDRLNRALISEGSLSHWRSGHAPGDMWSDVTATSAALRAYGAVDPADTRQLAVLRWLMLQRSGDGWSNTRDTAWVIAAIADYLAAHPAAARPPGGPIRAYVNGRPLGEAAWRERGDGDERVARVPAAWLRPGRNEVRLEAGGRGGLAFYNLELRQMVPLAGTAAGPALDCTVTREYRRLAPRRSGSGSWRLQSEPTGNRFAQGDMVRVRLTIEATREITYAVIEDPLPSGLEPTGAGTADDLDEWSFWYSSVDVRDDRVAFFARRIPRGKQVIEYTLRASTPGTSAAPPTAVYGMYSAATRAESAPDRVEIR